MTTPITLYSVNSWLAYKINQNYYKQMHYVWCCPFFNTKSLSSYDFSTARSSIPSEIYTELLRDVNSKDSHSAKIKDNRLGLLNGVVAKFEQGIINKKIKEELKIMISEAPTDYFFPLVYVIPYAKVSSIVESVLVKDRASFLSQEVRIRELPRKKFDVIDFQ